MIRIYLVLLFLIISCTKSYLQVSNVANIKYKKDGIAKITYKNGIVYEGIWKDDMKNGKGKLIDLNGTKYEGEWKNDVMFGIATITRPNGTIYIGEVSGNGIKNGKGKILAPNKSIYEGIWVNGYMVGIATITSRNKSQYVGEVKGDGIKNGKGKMTFKDGSSFEGNFENDIFIHGDFIDRSTKEVITSYSGDFKNNKLYSGTKRKEYFGCTDCFAQITSFKDGAIVKDTFVNTTGKSVLQLPLKIDNVIKKKVSVGLAVSAGGSFVKFSGNDPDITKSTDFCYTPSLVLSLKLNRNTFLRFAGHYSNLSFKFSNFGNNFEYNYPTPLTYKTENAKMQFQEVGISTRLNYEWLFIGGYFSKVISAVRSGVIFCQTQGGNSYLIKENYTYNFLDKDIYPEVSGQKPINEYVYGVAVGMEGQYHHLLINIGLNYNLSNYINKNYPKWEQEPNIDFYDTKEFKLGLGYWYLTLGYIF